MYFDCGSDLVGELAAPDALATFACSRGIASLNHEAFDIPVEETAIVVARCAQCQKVLLCKRGIPDQSG
jgi:hypothetical protein